MSKQNYLVDKETERKIDSLISKMTLQEKIGQLNQVGPSPVGGFEIPVRELQLMLDAGKISKEEFDSETSGKCWDAHENEVREGKIGSFLGILGAESCNRMQKIAVEESRLGIPLLFGLDVIHGYHTIFPIPLAEACSWNLEAFEKSAAIAAAEARACGINWTFAPMVDIARDARWGRIAEGAGEDTYLTSLFAAAKVRGFQGDDLSRTDKIAACAKHFTAYGACIGGRDYNSADISLQTLWETYLPPFKAAADAGVSTFMGAFNDINGIPCTTNPYLYKDILRDRWGFNGFVVSDAGAIKECVDHATAEDMKDASAQAINAGMDMDMNSFCYTAYLEELVRENKVTEENIDNAVRRILRIKYKLGLFENPYIDEELNKSICLSREYREAARDISRRSIVLLKNNGILPLDKGKKIAVVGELADSRHNMLGTWRCVGNAENAVSITDALKANNISFTYGECCKVDGKLNTEELKNTVRGAELVIAVVGEYIEMSGEAASLSNIGLHGEQDKMLAALKETGIPFVTVLINGRPLAVSHANDVSDALVEAWNLGVEAGNAICDVLFGSYNPSGRLTATFPNRTGECPTYYNHTPTGRPTSEIWHTCKYKDAPLKPLFPFGFGLSYTDYSYEKLEAEVGKEKITLKVNVTNTGNTAGEETVQAYVHDRVASRERPVRELKAFKKVYLKPGETERVTLEIDKKSLGFYNMQMEYIVEAGEFEVFVGHDSTAELSATLFISE